jgi:FdhD protein
VRFVGRVTVRRPVVRLRLSERRPSERRPSEQDPSKQDPSELDPAPEVQKAQRPDSLAVEEPLELRVGGQPLTVTMRTPGNDVELAHGFLLTEGAIAGREDVRTARYCESLDEDGHNTYNVLDLELANGVTPPVGRAFLTTAACGVCGKAALDDVRLRSRYEPAADGCQVTAAVLASLPARLRAAQRVFDTTGGLHAAGLFTTGGEPLWVREDVGRHNAVDKVLGAAMLAGGLPAAGTVLVVSGRASFELTQKAAMAGVPILAAVSAPSSLAAELAEELGITLVGFLRGNSMNVYSRADRIT